MDCVTITTELVNCEKKLYSASKDDYKLDLWRELKKRWMILGVLISMTLAVLAPKVGAHGGPLRTEYLSYIPLCCIYYSAGLRARASPVSAGLAALSAAHAHAAGPTLIAAARAALQDTIDYRLLKGALLSSTGAPCAWLSLAAARDAGAALTLLAVNYATALVAAPLTVFLICGRAPIPAIGPTLWSALCALPPLTAGALYARFRSDRSLSSLRSRRCVERVSTLALLYVDCCERTSTAGAGLLVGDVLATLFLAVWCVSGSALAVGVYQRLGLSPQRARAVAVCAVPKALHNGWETSTACVPSGLSRLPSVFLAPAQALLLAAVADCDDGE